MSVYIHHYIKQKNLDKPKKNRKNIFANSQNPYLCMCRMGVRGLAGGGGGNHGKFQRSFRKNIDSYLCLKERQISYEILIDASKQIHPCLIIMIEITCTCTSFIPLNVTMDNAIVNTVKEHSSCLIPCKHFFHS